ncbi:MAG: hypothetical protein GXY58_08135 [Planctomycetaceae bacterium]|nr:hypothetical protein [Planctomycetaceae bacterium]
MNMRLDRFLDAHPEWRGNVDLIIRPPSAAEVLEEWPDAAGGEVLAHVNTWTHFGVTRASIYMLSRRSGQSHRFAEMVAMQRPPRPDTDDVQMEGIPRVREQANEPYMRDVLARAKARGFTPPDDAIYHSGLARFPGDHEAFITPEMGRGYIRSLCERRGWGAVGDMEIAPREPERDPLESAPPMAEDLVQRTTATMVRRDPALKELSRAELRQRAIDKYGPSK